MQAMRTPRYNPPQTRHKAAGPVLALPSDSHALFEREWLLARSRASGVRVLPSHMHAGPRLSAGGYQLDAYGAVWVNFPPVSVTVRP